MKRPEWYKWILALPVLPLLFAFASVVCITTAIGEVCGYVLAVLWD